MLGLVCGAAACCDGVVLLRRGVPCYVMQYVLLFGVTMEVMDGWDGG